MSANKKSQAMVIDLIMLVIISSIFFIFLSSQSAGQSINAATIRSQSIYTERMLLSILNYQTPDGTVAELIGANYCINDVTTLINASVQSAFSKLDAKDSYFILTYENQSGLSAVYNNVSCVKTEHINLATFNMSLPCHDNIMVTFGYWPKTEQVEPC